MLLQVNILGMLKTGKKNLFVTTERGTWRELSPMCVLDFYVHESTQRRGFGRQLFEAFLANASVEPRQLAYVPAIWDPQQV